MSSLGGILRVAAPVAAGLLIASGFGAPLGVALGAAEGSMAAAVGGSALIGAAGGAIGAAASGGNILKGTAIGGVTGAAGGYVQGSGGLSNALGLSNSAIDAPASAAGLAGTAGQAVDMSGGAAGNFAGGAVDLSGGGAANGFLSAAPGVASGFAGALSTAASAAPSAASGWSSLVPSVLGGTGANPGIGSILGAGANLYSGIQGTATAKANAAAMQESNDKALALQAKNYNATTANLSPYLTAGNQANAQLQTDLGLGSNTSDPKYGSLTAPFTAKDLENTPGYQFQLQQGTQALQRQQAASGNYFSGAALKEGQQFATGLADSTYNTAYQQYLQNNQQNYGMLAGTAGAGQNAATNQGGFAAGQSNLGTSTLQNTGNITAAGNNAQNTAVNNSLAGALSGTIGLGGGASSYSNPAGGFAGALAAGSYYGPNGFLYNAQGQRIG